jgi:hypothetical protein
VIRAGAAVKQQQRQSLPEGFEEDPRAVGA